MGRNASDDGDERPVLIGLGRGEISQSFATGIEMTSRRPRTELGGASSGGFRGGVGASAWYRVGDGSVSTDMLDTKDMPVVVALATFSNV